VAFGDSRARTGQRLGYSLRPESTRCWRKIVESPHVCWPIVLRVLHCFGAWNYRVQCRGVPLSTRRYAPRSLSHEGRDEEARIVQPYGSRRFLSLSPCGRDGPSAASGQRGEPRIASATSVTSWIEAEGRTTWVKPRPTRDLKGGQKNWAYPRGPQVCSSLDVPIRDSLSCGLKARSMGDEGCFPAP